MSLVAALIGALIGFVLTLATQTFLATRNADIARLNDHVADILAIEKLALDYWLAPGLPQPLPEQAAAARLRGALAVSATFEETARRLLAGRYGEYQALDGELYDAATGGAFETVGRAADPARAIATADACHRLRSLLRAQRRRLFWAW